MFDLLDAEEFRYGPSTGLVVQAYLRDSPAQLERVIEWASASPRRPPPTIRLVKGAYWDHEVAEARQHGWQAPVFTDKAECDRNFEALTVRLLAARPHVRVAIGSHNLRSLAHAIALNRIEGLTTAIWSSRSYAVSATSWRGRWRRRAFAFASTARSGSSSRAWPTSSAACSRTPRTSRSSRRRPPACRSTSFWRRHDPGAGAGHSGAVRQRADPGAAPRLRSARTPWRRRSWRSMRPCRWRCRS